MPHTMPAQYTPKAAAAMLGVSVAALRKYADIYARHLSTEATTTPRTFTPDDMRLFAYVTQATALGRNHGAILAGLAPGGDDAAAFAVFAWGAPDDAPGDDADQAAASTALVPAAMLQAARALLEDAQRREREAQARAADAAAQADADARALRDRIATLERELGRAEGELAARRRPWWARLLGQGG